MLNRGRLQSKRTSYTEEISPMESMVNLVDVMLVFICGLLISIIIFWNINTGNLVVILDQKQLVKIDKPEEVTEQLKAASLYGNLGAAVMDPKTGNLYVVDDKGTGSGAEAEKTGDTGDKDKEPENGDNNNNR